MSDCSSPINDTRRFKRDSVLALMKAKDWIKEMKSSPELDLCIRFAEKDLEKMPEIETLEDFVYHINWVFCCQWDCSIQGWFEIQEMGDDV